MKKYKGKVIIINGSGGTGKDQFVKFFRDKTTSVYNKSTVDSVKQLASSMGWDGIKNDKSRKFISDLKDLWTNFNDFIFRDIINFCHLVDFENTSSFVFIHCREPDEIRRFKKYFKDDCITLLIRRPGFKITTNNGDRNVENYKYDMIIDNNKDLNCLEKLAGEFRNKLKGENICG